MSPGDRNKALYLLSAGMVTLSEAAQLAGITSQAMGKAARKAGIDAGAMRAAYLVEVWDKPLDRRRRPTRSAMRRRAEKAKAMWTWKEGISRVEHDDDPEAQRAPEPAGEPRDAGL